MADEQIPENLDLRFVAVQNTGILRELGDMRNQMTEVRGQMTEMRGHMTEMRGHMTEMREHMLEMRGQTQHIPQIRADISELQIGQALSADLKIVKRNVEDLQKNAGDLQRDAGDLKETGSIIEGRLVRIERQLGYVKA